MFENTVTYRRVMKKKALMDALEKAKKENNEWKIRRLEGKIACFDRKYYPNVLWDSSKGTYRKPKET